MKQIQKFFIIAVFLIITLDLYSQPENADAIFEKITKEYTLNEDGSMDFHYIKKLKLLSYYSFNRLYGETFIIFNPQFQKLEINKAYTIMADGKKVNTPENAFNEVLPRFSANSVAFNHLREMVVTHTALERGATIYLDYSIETNKGYLPAMMGNDLIEESSPISEMEIIVNVPSGKELHYKMLDLRTAPEITSENNRDVYRWNFSGHDASSKERFTGEHHKPVPRLLFSTAQNMEEVYKWVTDQEAFDLELDNEMETMVDKIVAETNDELDIMMKLQKIVVKEIAYEHIPLRYADFRARTPVEIRKSNGGTQLEKSILLSALLKKAAINAVPVFSVPTQFFDKNIGDLFIFHDVLIEVNTKKYGQFYISATEIPEHNMKYDLADFTIIPLYKNRPMMPVEIAGGKNISDYRGEFIILNDTLLTGKINLQLFDACNPYLLISTDKDKIKSLLSGGIGSGAVKDFTIEKSNDAVTEILFTVEKDNPFKEKSGYYCFDLPVFKNGFEDWRMSYLSSKREAVLEIPVQISEFYEFSFEIPEGFQIVNKKDNVAIKNKVGVVKIGFLPKGNKIKIVRKLEFYKKDISPAEYKDFRSLINLWLDKNYKKLILKKDI